MVKKLFLNEKFILFLILINSIIIFFQGFKLEESYLFILEYTDQFLTLLFLIEALIKLKSLGKTNYFKSYWNIFDFILVLLALPSFIAVVIPHGLFDLDFLLAFRILRVFKFFRFIKFVPNIDKLIKGVFRAAKASILIIISFAVFNFIIAIISCFLFKNTSPDYFGNPIKSIYSIFKIFTVEGWYEIPESLTENLESKTKIFFTQLYFIIILFIGGIFGLSLVNSIFVDSMISDNNDELEEKISNLESKINKLIEVTENKTNNK